MADTKLILSIDDLSHKLLSVESEVAVGESFDLIFDGLSDVASGSKVAVGLHSLSGKLLWSLDSPLSLIDGSYGVENVSIDTEEAAKVVRITNADTILTLVMVDEDGKQTVYGSAYLRLHKGYTTDAEPLEQAIPSIEKHNIDQEAHPSLIKAIDELREAVLQYVNETLEAHGRAEAESRNQAISSAIRTLDAELSNRYKGDLTFFAQSSATSAKASATGARVSSEAAKLTVEKLSEAYKLVEEVKGTLKEAGEKLTSIEGAIKNATDVANKLENNVEFINKSVTSVEDNAKAVSDAKTAIDTTKSAIDGVKNEFDKKYATVEKAEGYAKEAKSAKEAAQTARDEVKETTEANQSLTLSSSESAVQTLESATRAEEAAFGKTDESGNVVKDGAKQFAEQAEQAKDAIGDVGKRFEAVETSVAQKQLYISQLMLSLFDYKRYDFTVNLAALFPRAPCHEGFIYYAQYQSVQSRYFGVNGKVIPFPVNAKDGFRLTIIGKDETVVYAENSGKYKFTISGRGDSVTITHEVLSAFPENVGSYSYVVGWLTSNGYIVTSNGRILDGTTLVEVSTFSYSAGTSHSGARAKILKDGDTFYYKDASTHQFTTMTVGDDGVPALSVNVYKQNSAIDFYPIDKDTFVAVWHSRVVGITNANGYLYDNTGGGDTFLGVARVGLARLVFTINDVYSVYQGNTNSGGYKRIRAASNILMQDDVFFANNYGLRAEFACMVDATGNVFIPHFSWYTGKREFVHVFKNKEA